MRVWTNTSGQLIEAELVGVNAPKRAVKVRLKSGAEFEIAIDNLSPPDKAYAKDHWMAMQKEPVQAPVSAAPGGIPEAALKSLPESYRSRFDPTTRLEAIRRGGGTPEMEAAVVASLKRFKTSQNPDGSWGANNKSSMTGFALQCLLGHGETAESPEYGDTVMKGLLYLIELGRMNPHGIFSTSWVGERGGAGTYEHAIATTAVGEAYLTARVGGKSLPGMRESFETAIKTIISQQTSKGSWTYGGKTIVYNPDGSSDLSLANWHFHALNVAQKTGLKIDGLDSCIRKALSYIETTQTKEGGFGGASREAHYNQWSLSGGATAGYLMLGGKSTSAAKRGVRFITGFLQAEPPDWNKNCNLYCWHGYSNALFLNGGAEWTNFATQVMPQILAAQQPDGSFNHGRPSWPAGDAADATYRQALCTLILETFYR
ncbi:MAG: hypothetical protein B7Z37_04495 [Verrucomicrobia bacterium 12-59-8]|nr:MAG: hypothetical protein B7Z37_04495 [Verrucomicrobia bacterium 12-59-8]